MADKTFEREMALALKKIEKASEKTVRATAIEFFSRIVIRTPVGNPTTWKGTAPAGYVGGRLRANWQATINQPAQGDVNNVDPSGNGSTGRIEGVLGNYKLGQTAYLANNLPYAARVENGWSQQRPQGMVKVTEKEFKPILETLAKKNLI